MRTTFCFAIQERIPNSNDLAVRAREPSSILRIFHHRARCAGQIPKPERFYIAIEMSLSIHRRITLS